MSKIKSFYLNVDDDILSDDYEEYAEEYRDKSGVLRNTGLDTYTINKHYDDNEVD